MEPTIKPGTILVINRAAYGLRLPWAPRYLLRWATPRAGDIIIFPSPLGGVAVKRCAQVIGKSMIEALGDNSAVSYDSRDYGPVPVDSVLGKVMGIP